MLVCREIGELCLARNKHAYAERFLAAANNQPAPPQPPQQQQTTQYRDISVAIHDAKQEEGVRKQLNNGDWFVAHRHADEDRLSQQLSNINLQNQVAV